MAISKNAGRQEVIAARVTFTSDDLAAGTNEAIDLPEGAIVVGGYIATTTNFTGGVDITLTVSGAIASSALDADAGGLEAVVVTGAKVGAGGDTVDIDLGGTAPTGGAGELVIQYIVDGRAAFSEG